MKFRKALMATLIGALPLTANAAINFTFNYADANDAEGYTPAGIFAGSPSAVTDELKFTAESLVQFTSGTPFEAGSTFTDYVLVRIDQLFDNGDESADIYNQGPLFQDREITLRMEFTGTFIADDEFLITGLTGEGINIYYDAGPNAAGTSGAGGVLTLASFNDAALNSFVDGTLVEDATFVSGGGTTSTVVPDGAIDLFIVLRDILSTINPDYDPFELNAIGAVILETVVAVTNGNNALCIDDGGLQSCGTTEAGLAGFFGVAPGANVFHTRTDGSVEKETQAIPEPGTLALLGLVAVAFAGFSRRRNA